MAFAVHRLSKVNKTSLYRFVHEKNRSDCNLKLFASNYTITYMRRAIRQPKRDQFVAIGVLLYKVDIWIPRISLWDIGNETFWKLSEKRNIPRMVTLPYIPEVYHQCVIHTSGYTPGAWKIPSCQFTSEPSWLSQVSALAQNNDSSVSNQFGRYEFKSISCKALLRLNVGRSADASGFPRALPAFPKLNAGHRRKSRIFLSTA